MKPRIGFLAFALVLAATPALARTVEGQLAAGDSRTDGKFRDLHTFEGRAGDSITLDLRSTDFDPLLQVRTPDGRTHENDDFNDSTSHSRLELTLTATGTYTVTVTSYEADETGSYRLELPGANSADLRTTTGRLQAGDATLDSGQYRDEVTFEGRPGQRVIVDLRSTDFDTMLRLRTPSGRQQENDDFENSTQRSRIEYTLTEAGRHTIVVTSFEKGETGAYTLEYPTEPTVSTTAGAQIQRERGRLESGDEKLPAGEFVDRYTITGAPGERLVIDLRSQTFDPYLLLTRPDSTREENDDHEGSASWSQIATTLTQAGSYRVSVTSYKGGESGDYEMVITRTPAAGARPQGRNEEGRLAAGDSTLASGEFVDRFTLNAAPGQRLVVDLRSNEFDPFLMLTGPGIDGRVHNDDFEDSTLRSRIEHTATEAGEFTVHVTSYKKGETGAYSLALQVDQPAATPAPNRDLIALEIGATREGSLAAGDLTRDGNEFADLYAFEGQPGQTVAVDLRSTAFDTYLLVVTPGGREIQNDDFEDSLSRSFLQIPITEAGRYRVYASAYESNQTGSYRLSLSAVNAPAPARPVTAPVAASGAGTIYGIFVGISDYPDPEAHLDYTAEDAKNARDSMVTYAGLRPENAILLQNAGATRTAFEAALRRFGTNANARDTLVIFFSGHGGRHDRASGPDRSDPDGKDESLIFYDRPLLDDELSALLDRVPAGRQLLVFDSCFSGGFAKDVISAPGRMGLFSSEEDVTSAVATKFLAGGYLSKFFCDSLEVPAADDNKDGGLSPLELAHYISEQYRVQVKSGGRDFVDINNLSYQKLVVDRGGLNAYEVLLRRSATR